MRIIDIKDKKLRELAELRRNESHWEDDDDDLSYAFDWARSCEGKDFWGDVYDGKITELPRKHDLKELVDTLEDTIEKLKALIN